jgi:hypothetical protein
MTLTAGAATGIRISSLFIHLGQNWTLFMKVWAKTYDLSLF